MPGDFLTHDSLRLDAFRPLRVVDLAADQLGGCSENPPPRRHHLPRPHRDALRLFQRRDPRTSGRHPELGEFPHLYWVERWGRAEGWDGGVRLWEPRRFGQTLSRPTSTSGLGAS